MLHRWSLSYIIVQPEFSAPGGMRNRLCHELHLCHCNLKRDISHPVNEDHMAMTGCQLNSNSSCLHVLFALHLGKNRQPPLCCFIAYICRSEAILLNLGYTLHSYCVPCQGRMGQEGMCYVGSFRKKKIQFFQTKWHRLPEDRLRGLMQHITISQDVMNPEWHSAVPLRKHNILNPFICLDTKVKAR